jgi:hypothetical protein
MSPPGWIPKGRVDPHDAPAGHGGYRIIEGQRVEAAGVGMTTATGSIRLVAGKGLVCPICGIDHGCLLMPHRNAVVCLRTQDGCAKRRDGSPITVKGSMGHVFRLGEKSLRKLSKQLGGVKLTAQPPKLTIPQLKAMVKQFRSDLSPKRLAQLAERLGLSEKSLKAYEVGYDHRTGSYSFPMRGGDKRLCGIRLRGTDGRKLCVPGSRNGLFIPDDYDPHPDPFSDDPKPYLILTPEGPTDCAAARDCGFAAIGRPSNSGGAQEIEHVLRMSPPQTTIVVADRDETKYLPDGTPFWPGIEGAVLLLERLRYLHGTRLFMFPPESAKDLRAWLLAGGKCCSERAAHVLEQVVAKAQPATDEWIAKARKRLNDRKVKERRPPSAATGMPAKETK